MTSECIEELVNELPDWKWKKPADRIHATKDRIKCRTVINFCRRIHDSFPPLSPRHAYGLSPLSSLNKWIVWEETRRHRDVYLSIDRHWSIPRKEFVELSPLVFHTCSLLIEPRYDIPFNYLMRPALASFWNRAFFIDRFDGYSADTSNCLDWVNTVGDASTLRTAGTIKMRTRCIYWTRTVLFLC